MYIAVSGNIGAGKTTLVGKLADHYHFEAVYEAADQNPYLADFYGDMPRWAFPLQICFLSHRFRQGLDRERSQTAILDRTIYEDAEIFAKNLYQSGYLSQRDYQNYLFLYETILPLMPSPGLLIYLRGSTPVLAQRIQQRLSEKKNKQAYEKLISIDYLNDLNVCYQQWIDDFDHCPVIIYEIDTNDLREAAVFERLTEKIDTFLK